MRDAQGTRFKLKRPGSLRLAPAALHLNKGFTLLELIVVLFIVVLGFSAIGINLSSGNDSTELKVAARDIVSTLRYARGQALISHQETTVTLDLAKTVTKSVVETRFILSLKPLKSPWSPRKAK